MALTLTDLGVAIEEIAAEKFDGTDTNRVAELLDVARAARMTLPHSAIVAFEKAMQKDVPLGWRLNILYDGSRLRFALTREGAQSSLDQESPILGTTL